MKERKNRKRTLNLILITLIVLATYLYVKNSNFFSELQDVIIQISEDLQIAVSNLVIQEIDYEESTQKLKNPDRGFYYPAIIYGTENGFNYSQVEYILNNVKEHNATLIHLRIDISKLSGRANGEENRQLSEKDKSDINEAFDLIRKENLKTIVRIAYDFDGNPNKEPDTLDALLKHIEQFESIFETNKDIITVVETGFIGIYGEMHTSDYANTENINVIIKTVLKVVPRSITVNVRTLDMYMNLFGVNPITEDIAYDGSDRSRVGIYNDGYLGSETDLGTYQDREKALIFLEKHTKYTIFGGEATAPDNQYNDIEYAQEEMFRTHTTYLNYLWNSEITQIKWENTIYNGPNSVYKGQTAKKYIEDHLGYRFVLKESKMPKKVKTGKFAKIVIKIENTGFGNIINEKKVQLVLKNDSQTYIVDIDIDVRKWDSNSITTNSITLSIPCDMRSGECKVYLKITDRDNEQYTIQFANKETWDTSVKANYIGKMEVCD